MPEREQSSYQNRNGLATQWPQARGVYQINIFGPKFPCPLRPGTQAQDFRSVINSLPGQGPPAAIGALQGDTRTRATL